MTDQKHRHKFINATDSKLEGSNEENMYTLFLNYCGASKHFDTDDTHFVNMVGFNIIA
jgi:hypothetical protein